MNGKKKEINKLKRNNMQKYEYGAGSSRFKLEATTKFIAYAAMCVHYQEQANLLVIYEPEESKKDCWFDFTGNSMNKIDEIYGGKGEFEKFLQGNVQEIRESVKTIKRLV